LPPNLGIQGESGDFIFDQEKSGENEGFFRKSGKIRNFKF